MSYRFRPFVRDDLPMMARWLRTPEVARWWGDPGEQLALVTEDQGEPNMRQWIVETVEHGGGRPFAYVQAYPARAWGAPHMAHLPLGTEAVDAFVGEPAMLGVGHGGRFLRAFAEMLIAQGAPLVAIDPHVDNLRARAAYARAGFVGDAVVDSGDGPAILMLFKPGQPWLTP